MICSTMGVMAFAAEREPIEKWCVVAQKQAICDYYCYENCVARIVECPEHRDHDAEEWHTGDHYRCRECGEIFCLNKTITYVCLI